MVPGASCMHLVVCVFSAVIKGCHAQHMCIVANVSRKMILDDFLDSLKYQKFSVSFCHAIPAVISLSAQCMQVPCLRACH